VYALIAAVTYAVYVLVSGKVQQNVAPFSSSLYVISATALALFLIHQPAITRVTELTSQQMFIISGIAIISTIAPLTLFLAGLQKLSSSKASIVVMIEPVVATVAAFFFLGEQLTPLQIGGALLVLVALVINARK
jgi:drug/metabolite transporter (DMT)-like permease